MKATIDALKRGGVVLGAFLCATMGMPVFGAVDITDFIRSCGTGNYRVVCGNGTTVSTANGGAVASAFDGITEGTDFLPLQVDYKEKFYAAGRFPGGFMKREGKASDYEILIARLVDRALRPLFPSSPTPLPAWPPPPPSPPATFPSWDRSPRCA